MPVSAQAGSRGPRRGPAWRFLLMALAAGLWLLAPAGCNRDFSDPPGTAPDVEDTTGNVPDTVAGPDTSGPDTSGAPSRPDSLAARDLSLAEGGEPAAPSLTWYPADFPDKRFQLISDNAAVARVESGRIRPVSAGTAQVTVITEAGRLVVRFQVTVRDVPRPEDSVVRVLSVSAGAMSLTVGEEARPALTWNPPDAADKSFALASQDPGRAEIRGDRVYARAAGTVQIVVTTRDGGRTATFTATITERDTRIRVQSLTAADLVLPVGSEALPDLTWIPSDATVKTYLLTSADPEVAAVAGTRLRALKPGSTVVLVQSLDDATKTAAFKVRVEVPTRSVAAEDLTLRAGGPDADPRLAWTPPDATDKGFILSAAPMADPPAAAVDNKVRPLKAGVQSFTVTPTSGAPPATFRVTVLPRLLSLAAADTLLEEGDRDVLPRLTWDPPDVEDKTYVLASAGAAVRVEGPRLHAAAIGTARVSVRASEGGLETSFQVTVVQAGCREVLQRQGGGQAAAESRRCCRETGRMCREPDPPPVEPPPVEPPPVEPPPEEPPPEEPPPVEPPPEEPPPVEPPPVEPPVVIPPPADTVTPADTTSPPEVGTPADTVAPGGTLSGPSRPAP